MGERLTEALAQLDLIRTPGTSGMGQSARTRALVPYGNNKDVRTAAGGTGETATATRDSSEKRATVTGRDNPETKLGAFKTRTAVMEKAVQGASVWNQFSDQK